MSLQAALATLSSPAFVARPDALHSAVACLAVELGEEPSHVRIRAGHPCLGLTTSYALYVAYDDLTHARIQAEAKRLVWAASCGLSVPHVVAHGPSWLITGRVANDWPPSDGSYAAAAVATAQRISTATCPPQMQDADQTDSYVRTTFLRRGHARVLRLGRMLESRFPYDEYRSIKRAVAGLPKDRLAHGDFRPNNVLFDRKQRSVTVVDWEDLAYRPAHYDLCSLWPRLASGSDRDIVLHAALAESTDRAALGLLHHWLSLHDLANHVTKPKLRSADNIAAAKERVAESRANFKRWCT